MYLKHKLFAIALALVLALNLAAQPAAKASGPITLQSALASGKVEVNFSGTGSSSGDSIRLKVKKTSKAGSGPLVVTVPPGTMLRSSSASAQNMVVSAVRGVDIGGGMIRPASRISLSGAAAVTLILSAFCAEFEKDNPSEYTTFTVDAPDPMLACITKQGQNLSMSAQQAAVWIYTDRITYRHMSEKFPVDPGEFSAGQAVVERCRASIR